MFSKPVVSLAVIGVAQAVHVKEGYRPYAGTVPWHKDVSEATWVSPDWNVDYFVPNFGVDRDVMATQAHIAAAEKKLKVKLYASFA